MPIGSSAWPSRDQVAPELAEQPDEVALGDPELDVLAVLGLAPAHERVGVVGEPVDPLAEVPDPDVG